VTSVLTKIGAPRPYRLVKRPPYFVQFAVIECCDCQAEACFPWRDADNPTMIVQKFERIGWEIYKSCKCRCLKCKQRRKRQKAAFAKANEMQTPPSTPQTKPNLANGHRATDRAIYLLIIDEHGVPFIRDIEGAQQMLFGERTYYVIPQEDTNNG
jgi:hypothetical protein